MYNIQYLKKFDKEVVSHVCDLIFNERIGNINDIKDNVWYKFHNEEKEKQVEGIVECLLYSDFITTNNTPFSSFQNFMVYDFKKDELIEEGYLRK